ncbi:hypothetical protein AHAS_Ahas19G0374600 [Arachis hypogaea]
MRSPQQLRNGNRSPQEHHHPPRFHSTVAEHKLRRFNSLILLFRLVSFSFSLASSVFMLTNTHDSASPKWYHYDTFRFVLAANAIVAVYSLFELGASVWEISRGATLFPEVLQVWFDFGHDQVSVRIPAIVGECSGHVDGQDTEGRVYGQQFVLRAIGHRDRVGLRCVCVLGVHFSAIGLPSRLFHNQRFAFSPVSCAMPCHAMPRAAKGVTGQRKREGNIWVGSGLVWSESEEGASSSSFFTVGQTRYCGYGLTGFKCDLDF